MMLERDFNLYLNYETQLKCINNYAKFMHHTKSKADIAATKAIADLTAKAYSIFTAVVCEHLPFDFIAYRDGKCCRMQAKYASKNLVNNISYWTDSKGNHQKKYKADDFEFYAVYLSDID